MPRAWCVPWLLWIAAGCAGAPSPPAKPNAPAQRVPSRAPVWPRLAEVEGWLPLNTVPFPSRGHLTSPSYASVRVSPNARDAYASLVTDTKFPPTALVALFHQNRDGSQRGAIYIMEKEGERWRFLELDRDGRPAANKDTCARCHASAVADSLFGLPRPAATASE